MNIIDYLIIILIVLYAIKGFKNGAIKELITFGGSFLVIVIAFLLKNPISVFLYEHLPFFNFGGIFSGISVLNILVYELIAFLLVASILMLIYRLVIMATNIVDAIIKATVILEIPSKILGIFVGAIEGLIIAFIFLFLAMHYDITNEYIDASKYGNIVLTSTPLLSEATNSVYNSVNEIKNLAKTYKEAENKEELNLKALDVILKYKIIDTKNASILVESSKLKIEGAKELIEKYDKQNNSL